MNESILVLVALAILMGGSILVIDSVIIRRLRRGQDKGPDDQDRRQT